MDRRAYGCVRRVGSRRGARRPASAARGPARRPGVFAAAPAQRVGRLGRTVIAGRAVRRGPVMGHPPPPPPPADRAILPPGRGQRAIAIGVCFAAPAGHRPIVSGALLERFGGGVRVPDQHRSSAHRRAVAVYSPKSRETRRRARPSGRRLSVVGSRRPTVRNQRGPRAAGRAGGARVVPRPAIFLVAFVRWERGHTPMSRCVFPIALQRGSGSHGVVLRPVGLVFLFGMYLQFARILPLEGRVRRSRRRDVRPSLPRSQRAERIEQAKRAYGLVLVGLAGGDEAVRCGTPYLGSSWGWCCCGRHGPWSPTRPPETSSAPSRSTAPGVASP